MPSRYRRIVWVAPLQYWAAAAVVIVWGLVLVFWRERAPAPEPASVPATQFSAARAWPVLAYLADTIRYRVAGTPGADSAVAYLTRTLRRIPGIEVEVQRVSGAWTFPRIRATLAYTVCNVLVRIPGRSREAVLFDAHYDSSPGSVGAADDGVAVASLVEMIRALATGPRPVHSVIVNFDDGEEAGLVGAHGFTQHPWIRDVRAFVNLESAGPHGKAVLFQTGPGNAWLADTYARSVPYPYGTVLAQDIFQSGAIPSDTDFRIYRDFGHLFGLDIALYQGGWAYHTQRDRTWNVSPGTVQHMGENALALARALANGPLPGNVSRARAVYYDLLGFTMLSYTEHGAAILAALAAVLGVIALVVGLARGRMRAVDFALAFASVLASVIAALLAALVFAAMMAYIARRPMSWFAHPGAAVLAFAVAALAGMLFVQRGFAALLDRRGATPALCARAVQGAALLFWIVVLVLLTIAGIGSAYLALWWVASGTVGLLLSLLAPERAWWGGVLAGAIPAGVLTLQVLVLLTRLFVPVFGRLPLPFAPDLVLAILVAVPAAAVALALLPGAHQVGALGATGIATAVLAIAAAGLSLAQPTYTFRHPQRLAITHEQTADESVIDVDGADYNTPRRALARADSFHAVADPRALEYERAAGPTGFSPPSLELLATHIDSARGVRTLTFRATAQGAFRLRFRTPRSRITGWSVPAPLPVPAPSGAESTLRLEYVAPPDTGWRFSLDVRGAAPITIRLAAVRLATTPAAAAVMRALPTWTDVHAVAVNEARWTF